MGAMDAASPALVTPRLSGRRLAQRRGLLLGQRGLGTTTGDRLGVHPGARASMEARQHPAVAVGVEECEREALVAAGLLERVVPDEPDPTEGSPRGDLQG